MKDLEKLTADAKQAKSKAEAACDAATDGGSCNLDAVFFPLESGERAGPIVAAIQAAGLSASPTKWIGRGVMVQPPGFGQAGKRYASNEALCSSLRDDGWPVFQYYQMD